MIERPTTKIAIVGASSTGKTTLLNSLQNMYQDTTSVAFVHESAREFFKRNTVPERFSLPVQEQILELVLENEKNAQATNPQVIVTDTSALEVMFYTTVHGDLEGSKKLHQKLKPWIPTYTKFFLMNPDDVTFVNDEIRQESKETRDKVHKLMIDYYRQENLPFELVSGSVFERQKRMQDVITRYSAQ